MSRSNPMFWLAAASLLVLAILVYLLSCESQSSGSSAFDRPLKIYCAAALRKPIQAIASEFEAEVGRKVALEFGDSGQMLANATLRADGDLFLPADDIFVRLAQARGLVAQSLSLCRMSAVVLTRPGNPKRISKFEDLLKDGLKLGIANPDKAAIGKVVRTHLARLGKWDALAARILAQHSTVTDAANAVQIGSTDAAIVWDAVAIDYPELVAIRLPELDGAIGRVELAVLNSTPDFVGAERLARYIAASDRGLSQFRKAGFHEVEDGTAWNPLGGER